jgi:hypothetical protein
MCTLFERKAATACCIVRVCACVTGCPYLEVDVVQVNGVCVSTQVDHIPHRCGMGGAGNHHLAAAAAAAAEWVQ